jgi:hypothetical protein
MHQGHHTIKHATKITATQNQHGSITWKTPTGYTKDTDPPPF